MNGSDSAKNISIRNYSYELPESRIAKFPIERRDEAKLLVYREGQVTDHTFAELPQFLNSGDRLFFNETRVIHARLLFKRNTGSVIEILCLEPAGIPDPAIALSQRGSVEWKVMVGNLKRWKDPVLTLEVNGPAKPFLLHASLTESGSDARTVRFEWDAEYTFAEVITWAGRLPIPPYLDREAVEEDEIRYQTVYARNEGSVAAPTAGLHFTANTFDALEQKRINCSFVTLHVGAGTFLPVKSATMEGHDMHEERIVVSKEAINELMDSIGTGNNIVAVGTTSLRTLESLYWLGVVLSEGNNQELRVAQWMPYEKASVLSTIDALREILKHLEATGRKTLTATTKLMVAPGYKFRIVNALITNFHQPDSTLLLLVAAFAGADWRRIYDHALQHGYRFLSYGDSSLLLRSDQ